jgi:hypothetical protein
MATQFPAKVFRRNPLQFDFEQLIPMLIEKLPFLKKSLIQSLLTYIPVALDS